MAKNTRAAQTVSTDAALKEVGRILLAQDDLSYFAEYMSMDADGNPWFQLYPMHRIIAHELEQVIHFLETDGKEGTQFLMILVPFQHGKSTLVSRFFPAFALGKLPNLRVLEVSYGADLASEHSRYVRNMVLSNQYQSVFGKYSPSDEPVLLSGDSRAISAWDLAAPHRGGMIASGIGGAVPGRAKGLGIFDDPIKGHKEAESQDVRDDAWDFYVSALRVRMMAGVLVMTHWHPDDPAGRIIRNMITNPNGDKWKIIMMPGLIEAGMFAASKEEQRKKMLDGVYLPMRDPMGRAVGEVLCPAMLSKTEMQKIREAQGDYYFSALVQQMPYLRAGKTFKRDWFTIVDRGPGNVVWARIRAWDKAATSGGGARTAGVKMSWGLDDYVYVEHVYKDQLSSAEREEKMIEIGLEDYVNDGPFLIWHPQDPGSAGVDSAQATNDAMANKGLIATFDQVTGSKELNAEQFAAKAKGGRVRVVRGAWNDSYLEELGAFPKGIFKDQADASGSAFNNLRKIVEALKDDQRDDDLVYEERVNISPV